MIAVQHRVSEIYLILKI